MDNAKSGRSIELAPLCKRSLVFLAIFTLVLPALVIVAMFAFPSQGPSPVAAAAAAAVVVAISGLLAACVRRRAIVLAHDVLEIRAMLYTRRFSPEDIGLEDARVLDLREHPEARPLLKTNGLAVPGLAAGNFRDRYRKKLFCLVTGPRIVTLPLSDGSRLMVSPLHPQRFLQEIREWVERDSGR